MADLFPDTVSHGSTPPAEPRADAPLADRLRPRALDEVVGQEHLTGPEGAIGRMVAAGKLSSMILWGPPGTGKTSIARLLADAVGMRFVAISAVFSGVADLKKAFAEADRAAEAESGNLGRTLLFVDEIHRFNRAQQDGFLPFVERGTVTLVGATTENPSFELNAALLSRTQVLILHRLDAVALGKLLAKAEGLEGPLPLTPEAREALVASADGDGRFVLNQAETLYAANIEQPLSPAELGSFLQRRVAVYDKDREGHYNLISAWHKALRGSDPQAALYYMARMLVAGEEPLFVLRRLVRAAVEDIGLADPQALVQCLAAKDAYDFLGSPEGELAIVQACLYCATAPKSNAAYKAQKAAWRNAKETGSLMPPANILNAPTKLMKDIGYGKGYAYDHDAEEGFSGADYWPPEMEPQTYYEPVERGFERKVRERIAYWEDFVRSGNLDGIGATLILLLISAGAQAQSFVPRTDYEALIEAPKPVPSIPASLVQIVSAETADRLVVKSLDGREIPIDIEWFEPTEFKLFPGGRYLGFSYGGYEAYGYVLVDRAMRGEAAVFETGLEPVFSPDGRFVAAAEASESGFGNLNGVALWEILPGSTVRRLFTDALPFGWEWQVDRWVGLDCVAISAISEEWSPQSQEEYESTRDAAPRRHFALVVGDAGIELLSSFDRPGCTADPAAE